MSGNEYQEIIDKLNAIGAAQGNTTSYLQYFFTTYLQPFFVAFDNFVDWIQAFLTDYAHFIYALGFGILIILTLKWLSRW